MNSLKVYFFSSLIFTLICLGSTQKVCDGNNRTACGFIGIDQSGCEDAGCCWAVSSPPSPYCFQPSLATTSFSVSTSTSPTTGSGSYSTTFSFSGGVSFCSQCGDPGSYACSDKSAWTGNNLTFIDRTPSGNSASHFSITTTGSYGCGVSSASSLISAINGASITTAIVNPTSDHCACNTCDGSVIAESGDYIWGFPLNYGGKNTLSINVFINSACLFDAVLTVYYKPTPAYYAQSININPSVSYFYPLCGATGYLSCSSASNCNLGTFRDPLPKGALLISAAVSIFGDLFPGSGSSCATKRTGSITFAGQTFPTSTIYRNGTLCFDSNYCSPPWTMAASSLYQNGLAGYTYNGYNSITLTSQSDVLNYYYVAYTNAILYYIMN